MDDLEHRSHRANLILNIQEDSKNGPPIVKFISDLLMEVMGVVVFGSSLLAKDPGKDSRPFPFWYAFTVSRRQKRHCRDPGHTFWSSAVPD